MRFRRAAGIDELWVGEKKAVLLEGRHIVLIHLEDGVRAYEDRCAHLGVPISEGRLDAEQGKLVCRAHHWEYDPGTGSGLNPRTASLVAFPVKVEDGQIWVGLESDERDT